jgi:prevent-host-death family protein
MDDLPRKGAEEARSQLPSLLEGAEAGRATVITRRGRPVAVVAPVDVLEHGAARQAPLTPLAGSGRGLWGADSRATLRGLREEWPS